MNIVYLLGIVLAFVFVIFGITFDPGGTGEKKERKRRKEK